ncbi:MAG: hypothetical protein OXC13_02870 [Caldilineaceae bacterium]|nr:hypothetical protein [Caldilineaceae bacterium]
MNFRLGALEPALAGAEAHLERERIVPRIWARDHTVWAHSDVEIADRLGWLDVHRRMATRAAELTEWAQSLVDEGFRQAVLIGMGGSSLAPEMFGELCGCSDRGLKLLILDTTDPEQIAALEKQLDLAATLFVVATKSGGTVETLSGYRYFRAKLAEQEGSRSPGKHFVAITDPGSSLVGLAAEEGFRRIFENDPNIGGRYSALSLFGLVPLALVGGDVDRLLAGVSPFAQAAERPAADNDAARFGMLMGRLALAGRDKLTILRPPSLTPLGDWIEQLIAESLGKSGRSVVPVLSRGDDVDHFRDDRFCVVVTPVAPDEGLDPAMASLADRCVEAGHPVVVIPFAGPEALGGHLFLWEFATAVAGHALGVHPFDQPDVEAAKVAARAFAATYEQTGTLPEGPAVAASPQALDDFLVSASHGDYLTIQAYLPFNLGNWMVLEDLRREIGHRFHIPVTVGFGPRFLHSTGQLHKGGSANGLNLQLVRRVDPAVDVPIPGTDGMTFGTLQRAQALGDAEALRNGDRRLLTLELGENPVAALASLLSWSGEYGNRLAGIVHLPTGRDGEASEQARLE